MRLLKISDRGELSFTDYLTTDIPPYAILSHTWGTDQEEVTFKDFIDGRAKNKEGYTKIQFCADQARKDGLRHFWIDTCCIDKTDPAELSEAIVSMFRWYASAARCYVFLDSVTACKRDSVGNTQIWEAFRNSRWFTRGWTLQELLAPKRVGFYSRDRVFLGDKDTLKHVIHEITGIPIAALHGIFNVSMPPVYGERENAFHRLTSEIVRTYGRRLEGIWQSIVASDSRDVVRDTGPTSTPTAEATLLDRRKTMLASLGFEQMDSRRSTIRTAYSTTCQWLLRHPDYLDWIDPQKIHEHCGFLWINGKPGAGKSTLVKFAHASADRARPESEIILSFFFNARGDELEKSTVGMYRALLFQLLTTMPDLQDLLDDVSHVTGQSGSPVCTVETLCELLSAATARLGHRQLKCFIDALDECDEQQVQDMIAFFEELGQATLNHGSQLYICFASRHYPTINIRSGRQLTLEYEDGHAEDLEKYVQSHLRAGKGKVIEEVRTQIRDKANGVFLWVVLVVPMLNEEFKRGRIFALQKKLREIPAKLSDLFKDILTKDCTNMDDLLLCLQWILFAERPLRREEFYFAMLAGLESESEYMTAWNSEDITTDDMNRFVLNSSKGLAELTRSKSPTVQFIHESVRDYLIKEKGLHVLWPDLGDGSHFLGESHQRLKGCCLKYISIDVGPHLGNIGDSLPKASTPDAALLRQSATECYPFLEYAVRKVLYHADKAQATGVDQGDFIRTFPFANWIWTDNLLETHEVRRHTPNVSFLYILAENNLASLTRIHRSNLSCFDVEAERYGLPLFAALATGSDECVRALLVVQAETHPPTSLFRNLCEEYCRYGNRRAVLARDFAFSQRRGPLTSLAEQGNDILLALLCASDKLIIEATGHDGRTPLSWVAGIGHEAVVRLLVEKGAKLESQDKYNRTPLSWAAEKGHGAVDTAVMAADRGHEEVVRLLVEKGADLNPKDKDGRTPLSRAVQMRHVEVVRLLVDKGADLEPKDNSGRTPLSWAADRGHEEVVRLLVDKGAELEPKDKDGRTLLPRRDFNLDFSSLENSDVLENFDFDRVLHTSNEDTFDFDQAMGIGEDLGVDTTNSCDMEKTRLRYVDLVDVQHVPASDSRVCITKVFH
ncbi:hypothetical protein LTR41_010980 [Exophiala xenobiotica]|nr:hypothetical protein LTR41_010980 [Exophiala xenobiotica]